MCSCQQQNDLRRTHRDWYGDHMLDLHDPEARPNRGKMRTVSTYMSSRTHAEVERAAKARGMSAAAFIRAAVVYALEREAVRK